VLAYRRDKLDEFQSTASVPFSVIRGRTAKDQNQWTEEGSMFGTASD